MEIVKRGHGLFSIAFVAEECEIFENYCKLYHMTQENVLKFLEKSFLRYVIIEMGKEVLNGT